MDPDQQTDDATSASMIDAAMDRARSIIKMLIADVRAAIDARAVLEAGNNLLHERGTVVGPGAETYNIIRSSLAFSLTLTVARMFDYSKNRKMEKQTKASIPALAHWLRIPGVRSKMVEEAGGWIEFMSELNTAMCIEKLDAALTIVDQITSDETQRLIHERVRQTRDARLAHSLYDQDPTLPLYSDIFGMLDDARDFVSDITLALLGRNSDFEDIEQNRMDAARKFWLRALSGSWLPTDGKPLALD